MKVSFYLSRPESKTETAIFARVCYNGNKMKYYLPDSILPKFWNKEMQRAKETKKFAQFPEFNRNLESIDTKLKNTFRKYINDNDGLIPTPRVLKPLFDAEIIKGGKVEKITFVKFITDYIEKCKSGNLNHAVTGKPLSAATIMNYNNTLFNLERYIKDTRKKVDFDSIDIEFYNSFKDYLETVQKQSLNTIGKHIKIIKSMLNEATEQGINKNLAYKSKKFITLSEDTDTIYLSECELQLIANLNLKKNLKLDSIRDLFLVGCYTGLRFSDLSTLTPDQIKGSMITITQIKTGKPVVIPVHDIVKTILKKYNGNLPKAISNQKTNEYLKEMCELIPELKTDVTISGTKGGEKVSGKHLKYELVTTHTARRSFATNHYLKGLPTLSIMAITGHKTEKSFLKYIKVTPNEHAIILQEFWANESK